MRDVHAKLNLCIVMLACVGNVAHANSELSNPTSLGKSKAEKHAEVNCATLCPQTRCAEEEIYSSTPDREKVVAEDASVGETEALKFGSTEWFIFAGAALACICGAAPRMPFQLGGGPRVGMGDWALSSRG